MPREVPRAILFDVDGTLYSQGRLRRAMLLRLLRAHALAPVEGVRTLRCLSAFRRAQETLRHDTTDNPAHRQAQEAARRSGMSVAQVERAVERWMEEEPLPLLPPCRRPGIAPLLAQARSSGMRLGVLSDYPATRKLERLELGGFFDVTVCAQDPEVGVFKPHPRGIEVALRRLGVAPADALYVGDRAEVDAAAARAAGVPCVILTDVPAGDTPRDHLSVRDFAALHAMLFGEAVAGGQGDSR